MMHYVIDKQHKHAVSEHQDRKLCVDYIETCVDMWHHDADRYVIVKGAKERDAMIKELRK